MIEFTQNLTTDFLNYVSRAESFYVVESSLVLFVAFLLDLFQRKTLFALKEKAKRTKMIWDDVVLGALPNDNVFYSVKGAIMLGDGAPKT